MARRLAPPSRAISSTAMSKRTRLAILEVDGTPLKNGDSLWAKAPATREAEVQSRNLRDWVKVSIRLVPNQSTKRLGDGNSYQEGDAQRPAPPHHHRARSRNPLPPHFSRVPIHWPSHCHPGRPCTRLSGRRGHHDLRVHADRPDGSCCCTCCPCCRGMRCDPV